MMMNSAKYRAGMACLSASAVLLCVSVQNLAADELADQSPSVEAHRASMEEWRQRRHERLASEDGWMTLVGLEWLQDGANRVGRSEENDIQLPGGADYWGTVYVGEDGLRFVRADDPGVTVDDTFADEAFMVSDADEGTPTRVRSGTLSFYPILRESYALRVKDTQATVRVEFTGIDNYEIQRDWRIEGRLIPAEEGTTIEIANVQGQLTATPVFGTFEFEREGMTHRLLVEMAEGSSQPWIIFNDRTNSHGTYGAGRYVYGDEPEENGRLVVDFNKAYNPPCAFTDFATCPIPPQENRLNLAVTAGEKDFHDH
jgi:hypothetical protein